MALRLRNKKTNPNLAYERYWQIKHVNQRLKYVYTYEKGLNRGKNMWIKQTKQHKESEFGCLGKYLRTQSEAYVGMLMACVRETCLKP